MRPTSARSASSMPQLRPPMPLLLIKTIAAPFSTKVIQSSKKQAASHFSADYTGCRRTWRVDVIQLIRLQSRHFSLHIIFTPVGENCYQELYFLTSIIFTFLFTYLQIYLSSDSESWRCVRSSSSDGDSTSTRRVRTNQTRRNTASRLALRG